MKRRKSQPLVTLRKLLNSYKLECVSFINRYNMYNCIMHIVRVTETLTYNLVFNNCAQLVFSM